MELGLLIMGAFFVVAYALLVKSGHERHGGVVFMIRSKYGIHLIDRMSKLNPRFWNFIADFSVLLSFGGLGGYYLSSMKGTRSNLHKSILLLGLISALPIYLLQGFTYCMLAVFLSLLMYAVLPRCRGAFTDFVASSFIFASITWMLLSASPALRIDGFLASAFMGVFGLPSILVYGLFSHGMNILSSQTTVPGVSPMVPTSQGGNVGVSFPGYDIFIPWWHALLALFITLVVHEGAHGVLVRCAKVRLKSTGILSLFSVPVGAFVEPDEEQLNRKSSVARMRVFSMGSFANIVTGVLALVAILLLGFGAKPLLVTEGMKVVGHMPGFAAEEIMPAGTVIYHFNGVSTSDYAAYRNVSSKMAAGNPVVLNTSLGVIDVVLKKSGEDESRGFIGVYLLENVVVKSQYRGLVSLTLLGFINEALGWILFFNINIGLVNLLPILPFDGGRMFKEFAGTLRLSELNVNRVLYAILGFTAVLLLVNMVPLFGMMGNYFMSLII